MIARYGYLAYLKLLSLKIEGSVSIIRPLSDIEGPALDQLCTQPIVSLVPNTTPACVDEPGNGQDTGTRSRERILEQCT